MDAQILSKFQELISQGEKLVPEGGLEFSGYNAKMQSQYLTWRKHCLDSISKLGDKASAFRDKIAKDENGAYFYQSSAQNVLDALKSALPIVETEVKKNSVPPTPPPAPSVQEQKKITLPKAAPDSEAQPKSDVQKQEHAKKETPKSDPVKQEAPKQEISKPEPAKQETPKQEIPKPEPPKQEAPKQEIHKPEPVKQEAPKQETPKPEPAKSTPPVVESKTSPNTGSSKSILVLSSSETDLQNQLIAMLKEIGIDGILFQRGEATDAIVGFLNEHAESKFAFYLFTAKDMNSAMFELGYLVGKIGAKRVCCIHHKDDAPPKGIPGITYKEIVVKLEEISFSLIKDLKAAGYTISL